MSNPNEALSKRDAVSFLLVVAALLACGAPNNAQPARHASPPQVEAGARRCTSDFSCSFGQKCVKDSLAFDGVCAQPVNQFGTPVYSSPDGNSIGAGTGTCSYDTQCSIGFRCVKTSGGLYGNCMK